MAQAVGTNQPLLTANGVLFDGIDNFMSTANFTLNQPITYYMVIRQITWSEVDYLISGKAANGSTAIRQAVSTPGISVLSSNLVANNTNLALNTFGYVRAIINRSSSKLQVNAVNVEGSGDVGSENAGGLNLAKIGVAALYFGNVEYKELIVRDKADNSTDETLIYNYLKTKYGI
ncbi:MAG: hypothetical protein IPN08_10050 [Bacteroidales bacterium]|nr:hypothetical protein [Bacteroidales bacterium]